MFLRTYYAMKNRLGGTRLNRHEQLVQHRMHSCPGNVNHKVPRAELIFNRRVKHGHACYVMYWRSHLNEYKAMESLTGRHNLQDRSIITT